MICSIYNKTLSNASLLTLSLFFASNLQAASNNDVKELFYHLETHNKGAVEELLERGVSANLKNMDGQTPIEFVFSPRISHANLAVGILKLLVTYGAEVDESDPRWDETIGLRRYIFGSK